VAWLLVDKPKQISEVHKVNIAILLAVIEYLLLDAGWPPPVTVSLVQEMTDFVKEVYFVTKCEQKTVSDASPS